MIPIIMLIIQLNIISLDFKPGLTSDTVDVNITGTILKKEGFLTTYKFIATNPQGLVQVEKDLNKPSTTIRLKRNRDYKIYRVAMYVNPDTYVVNRGVELSNVVEVKTPVQ